MNNPESHEPEQLHQTTDYQRLLQEAQSRSRAFTEGETVNIIGPQGKPIPGLVLGVETRNGADFVKVQYDSPVSVDDTIKGMNSVDLGTAKKTESIEAGKLALMQIPEEQIIAASPKPDYDLTQLNPSPKPDYEALTELNPTDS